MTNSSIDQIKETEIQAENLIEQARQNVEHLVSAAEKKGQQDFENAADNIQNEIEAILAQAKADIQQLMAKEQRTLEHKIKELENIHTNRITQAAGLVFKQLAK